MSCPALTSKNAIDMWQFGGTPNYIRSNQIAGKVVDQNFCYKDYPTFIKNSGLNGYGKIGQNTPKTEELKAEQPAPTPSPEMYYTVKKGDTLSKIAKAYGTTAKAIQQLNPAKIKNINIIQTGWKIRVK